MSAAEAAEAMRVGWLAARPDDEVALVPLSDGGPGFVDALASALGGALTSVEVVDPMGLPVSASYLLVGDTAYIESAQACGLHLLAASDRDPRYTSTYGVGQLIDAALAAGARKIVIGLGGSSTNDAGAGLLAALGATAADEGGSDVTHFLANGGLALKHVHSINLNATTERLRGVEIEIATDVDNPLLGIRGATNTYAPQKGADTAAVMQLEGALEHFANVIGRRPDGKSAAVALGAGAAGGLGFALLHLGAARSAGISRIIEMSGLAQQLESADLVITGEGSFDYQSLSGKVVDGIGRAALAVGVPVVVVAGRVDLGRREWQTIGIHGVYSLSEMVGEESAMFDSVAAVQSAMARVARTWGR